MRRGAQGNELLTQHAPRAASREDESPLLDCKKYREERRGWDEPAAGIWKKEEEKEEEGRQLCVCL